MRLNTKSIKLFAAAAMALSLSAATPVRVAAENSGAEESMYRLYNPNSGEHFYTASINECNSLRIAGWRYEGVGWTAPEKSSTPVYRLYNANAGEHHYTESETERDFLKRVGWRYEGIGWYSDDDEGVPLYREYNSNAKSGSHNYTTSKRENDHLVSLGWHGEGIGWYGLKITGDEGQNPSGDDSSTEPWNDVVAAAMKETKSNTSFNLPVKAGEDGAYYADLGSYTVKDNIKKYDPYHDGGENMQKWTDAGYVGSFKLDGRDMYIHHAWHGYNPLTDYIGHYVYVSNGTAVTRYECIGVVYGHNDGHHYTLNNGNLLNTLDCDAFVASCADTSGKTMQFAELIKTDEI